MLTGRIVEKQRLETVIQSTEAEFVVIYGRRRVGKTYLIRQFFKEKRCVFFQATGLQKGNLKKQLGNFAISLSETFTSNVLMQTPVSWDEAFRSLTRFVETRTTTEKIIIFLDELPWMASKRSGMLEALDYHWNHSWSKNPNIILVVCGSSAAWLINNISNHSASLWSARFCAFFAENRIKNSPLHNLFNSKGCVMIHTQASEARALANSFSIMPASFGNLF